MRPLLSPEEMGRADRAAIDSGTPAAALMERAGRAVARTAVRLAGGRYGRRVAVVCGKGNNGGDGFVAARILRRDGMLVRVLFVGNPDAVAGAAGDHLARLRAEGCPVEEFSSAEVARADVVVDALFGTGFRGPAEGEAAAAIEAMNESLGPVIAVDIPSGVDGATGNIAGPAVKATATVAMGAVKIGGALPPGSLSAGTVEVADIGIEIQGAGAFLAEAADVLARLPQRASDAHKRSSGAVALMAGSAGMSGAAILAGRGAMRMGAGYTTIGLVGDIDAQVSTALPEVLTRVVTSDSYLGPDGLDTFEPVIEDAGALGIGPGIGTGDAQRKLLEAVLASVDKPVIVDADGLNALAADTSPLVERSRRGRITIVTPHPGEASRLRRIPVSAIQADRLGMVRSAAEELGCVVVLKGHRTIVARADHPAIVIPTGGPELATAGTGDVLTGAISALAAAGVDPFDAAWCGAYVHGLAGELAARATGGAGVVAWDVAEALGRATASIREL